MSPCKSFSMPLIVLLILRLPRAQRLICWLFLAFGIVRYKVLFLLPRISKPSICNRLTDHNVFDAHVRMMKHA